jgi:glycosidase
MLITEYGVDGLRIDTVPEVPAEFWHDLTQNTLAGGYAVGEVYNGKFVRSPLFCSFVVS